MILPCAQRQGAADSPVSSTKDHRKAGDHETRGNTAWVQILTSHYANATILTKGISLSFFLS